MKILLLGFNVQESVFPLGLMYLKGYLLKYHPDVEIDLKEFSFGNRQSYETNKNLELQVLSYILLSKPEVVAFSNYIWSGEMAQDFARAIKVLDPTITVVLGGVEVDRKHLRSEIDFIVVGEGEIALKELVDFLKGERVIEEVHNILCVREGRVVETVKKEVENLDEIPFPYRCSEVKHFQALRVETARGCVFNCNFCHYAKPAFRTFSLPYLRENLEYLFSEFSFHNLTFIDANFNTHKERMFTLLDMVEEYTLKYGKKIEVHCELRPELIDAEMVERIEKYSFALRCELGFQSSSSEVLRLANRPTNMEKVRVALGLLNTSRIKYKIDLMYGLPGDTFFSFLQSMRFLLKYALRQKKVVAHHFMLLNNTTFNDVKFNDGGFNDTTHFTDNNNNNNIGGVVRFTPLASSMVIKTQTQDVLELYLTKLFVDMVNEELGCY